MLTISETALGALERDRDALFIRHLSAVLRQDMPSETATASDSQLDAYVSRVMQRCDGFGIGSEEAIGQLAALGLSFGEVWLDDPDVRAYLASGEVDASVRVDALVDSIDSLDAVAAPDA